MSEESYSRDRWAAEAMKGLLGARSLSGINSRAGFDAPGDYTCSPFHHTCFSEELSRLAYKIGDAMLAEREKPHA